MLELAGSVRVGRKARIRGVIFDLDGVLRAWPVQQTRSIERLARIPAGAIHGVAFEPSLLHRALTGIDSDAEWRAAVARQLQATYGAPGREAVTAWAGLRGKVRPAMLELVRDVRRAIPVALVTNATSRLEDDLASLRLTAEFDLIVSSAATGFVKPDPVIFVEATHALGIPPAECAVVDDDAAAIATARHVGMAGIRYRGPVRTRRRLASLGVGGLA